MTHVTDDSESYDVLYSNFDSPAMRHVRQAAYGEDIGQHSWVLADDLRRDLVRLRLSKTSTLLDLGCGPCGPLAFAVASTQCRAVGVELSASALQAARGLIGAKGLSQLIELRQLDLNQPLPFPDASFACAMSFDVILHLADREATCRGLARVLMPGGRFLFTDAAVLTGGISNEQMRLRSVHGFTKICAESFNERCLERAGFRVVETEDRTPSVISCATGRLKARLAHREELERLETAGHFDRERQYLETVITLAETKSLSRVMYLAERAS
jgi:SAM-dependent methyltransferase